MSALKNIRRIILTSGVAVLFTACGSGDFTVNSTFSNTKNIQEGALVYFENQTVGQVIDAESSGAGVAIMLKLDKQAIIKIGSEAAIVVNRMKPDAPLEIYNRTLAQGDYLQDGQSIKGFDSMFQLGAWMVGDSLKLESSKVSAYLESFQGYLQSDKFDQDKQAVNEKFNSAKGVAQDAIRQLEEDLNQAADEFASSEQVAADIVADLGDDLAPLMKELANNGTALMAQLEKLSEQLEHSDADRQQAGAKFLDSMIQSMEKLSQAMQESPKKTSKPDKEAQQ
ncbi:MAG: ABC-type transporter Mla subunit MlaD [Arenicella sp.]|jgi:ABC-type transporter Mla subunit MlaD